MKFLRCLQTKIFTLSPNLVIIVGSLIIGAALFLVAVLISGIWQDWLINLSAGAITVVITVLLVDKVRVAHAELISKVPRDVAVSRLRASHTGLLMTIATKNMKADRELAKGFMQAGTKMDSDTDSINQFLTTYASQLVDQGATKYLANFSENDLTDDLKDNLIKLRAEIDNISRRYNFSFTNIDFNSEYADLSNKIDGAINCFVVYGLDAATLTKIITPSSSKDEAAKAFIGAAITSYLKSYTDFIEKYHPAGL